MAAFRGVMMMSSLISHVGRLPGNQRVELRIAQNKGLRRPRPIFVRSWPRKSRRDRPNGPVLELIYAWTADTFGSTYGKALSFWEAGQTDLPSQQTTSTYVSGYADFFLRIPSTRHIVLRTCYVVETFSRPLIRSQISDQRWRNDVDGNKWNAPKVYKKSTAADTRTEGSLYQQHKNSRSKKNLLVQELRWEKPTSL